MSSVRSRSAGRGDLELAQAVVEVLAKTPLLDHALEVLVGRRDHAHVDLVLAAGADR